MTALNTEIDALDTKVSGKVQLDLYAAVQDLLLDRLVWFLRNVDLTQRLAGIVEHYGAGISEVEGAARSALCRRPRVRSATPRRRRWLPKACRRRSRCRSRACARLPRRPTSCWSPTARKKSIAEVTATYFAAGSFFGLDRIREPARAIVVSDYFDRLALDRALDSIAEAERRLTAEMVGNGAAGPAAVEAWVKPRAAEVERIRAAVNDIAGSPMTISKLSVAASLVGDLVKH